MNSTSPKQTGNGSEVTYGSRVSLKEVLAVANEELPKLSNDHTYIKNIAVARGSIGEEDVRHYHAKSFNESHAELLEKCSRLQVNAAADLEGVNLHIKELSAIVHATKRYRDFNRDSAPWTKFARIQVGVLIVFSILLLGVGINTIAQVLYASGIPGFEKAWRCYLFSLTPIGIAFGIKGLRSFIHDHKRAMLYTVGIWVVGLAFGFMWVLLFAERFPGLTQSASDIVNSISISASNSKPHTGDFWFIVASILAESFLAAGCWLTAEAIIERHSPPVRKNNPAYDKVHSDLDHFLNRRSEQESLIGKINGKIQAIDDARKRFVEEAVGSFRAAVKSYQQAQSVMKQFKS